MPFFSVLFQILEPCFKYKMLDAGNSLCCLLKMVFIAFPLDAPSTPQDVKLLYQKVDELIQKHISAVTTAQTAEDNSANSISFILLVVKTLTEVQKSFVDPHILVRILQRLARDMSSSAGSHLKPVSVHLFFLSLICIGVPHISGSSTSAPPTVELPVLLKLKNMAILEISANKVTSRSLMHVYEVAANILL